VDSRQKPCQVFFINFVDVSLNSYEKSYDNAIEVLEKALEIAPKKATSHHALGFAYFNKGLSEKAEIEFQTVLEIDPKRCDTYYYLSR